MSGAATLPGNGGNQMAASGGYHRRAAAPEGAGIASQVRPEREAVASGDAVRQPRILRVATVAAFVGCTVITLGVGLVGLRRALGLADGEVRPVGLNALAGWSNPDDSFALALFVGRVVALLTLVAWTVRTVHVGIRSGRAVNASAWYAGVGWLFALVPLVAHETGLDPVIVLGACPIALLSLYVPWSELRQAAGGGDVSGLSAWRLAVVVAVGLTAAGSFVESRAESSMVVMVAALMVVASAAALAVATLQALMAMSEIDELTSRPRRARSGTSAGLTESPRYTTAAPAVRAGLVCESMSTVDGSPRGLARRTPVS